MSDDSAYLDDRNGLHHDQAVKCGGRLIRTGRSGPRVGVPIAVKASESSNTDRVKYEAAPPA